jgi:hypothetical protein
MKCYQGHPRVGKVGIATGRVSRAKQNGVGARKSKQGKVGWCNTREGQSRVGKVGEQSL